MKPRSVGLAAKQALSTTTLCWCWYVERSDLQVFGFTTCSTDIEYDGVVYRASTGVMPSAVQSNRDVSVSNMEVTGMLDSDAITEEDLLVGKWDNAYVHIFELDFTDVSLGHMTLTTGVIGEVSAGRNSFKAELRGLAQRLQQPVGRVYSAACNAVLGDTRCGVDLPALAETSTVTSVASRRAFSDSARAEADDYFGAGYVLFTSGLNAGIGMEILSFSSGLFTLQLPLPYNVSIGDTFTAYPGCRKRFAEDCVGKYSNGVNFRGFPHVPLNDKVLGNGGVS
jgi:uncharacterized phage protein (TIGR02218 family)